MSKKRSAFIGVFSSQIFMVISMMLSIVSTPFMLRYLDKQEYGVFIIFFQIITYLGIFNFGTSATVIRYLSVLDENDDNYILDFNKTFSTGIIISSFFGITVVIAGLVLSCNVNKIFTVSDYLSDDLSRITRYIGLLVGLQFITRSFGTVSFVRHNQFVSTTVAFVNSTAGVLFTIIFMYFKFGLWSFVYANFIALFISTIISLYVIVKKHSFVRFSMINIDKIIVYSMMQYGFFAFLVDVSNQIIVNTDRIVVGSVVSVAAVSVFSITVRIPEVLTGLIQRIPDNIYPMLAQKVNDKNTSIAAAFSKLMGIVFSSFAIGMSIVYLFNEDFIKLWVGETFFMGDLVLLLAIMVSAIQLIGRICVLFLTISGKLKSYSLIAIIEAFLNITISIYLGKKIGAEGVLIGTIISSFLTSFVFLFYKMHKEYNIDLMNLIWYPILKPLVVVAVLVILFKFSYSYILALFGLSWISFVVISVSLSLVFLIICYVLFLQRYLKIDFANKRILI